MAEKPSLPEHWKIVGKTGVITRRFEFPNYAATSAFLDELNALSESTGLFPDLGFASTYVNVSVSADQDGGTAERDSFAEAANRIGRTQST